jgi:hypothetical protein
MREAPPGKVIAELKGLGMSDEDLRVVTSIATLAPDFTSRAAGGD